MLGISTERTEMHDKSLAFYLFDSKAWFEAFII